MKTFLVENLLTGKIHGIFEGKDGAEALGKCGKASPKVAVRKVVDGEVIRVASITGDDNHDGYIFRDDEDYDHLTKASNSYPTKAACYRAAAKAGYTHASGGYNRLTHRIPIRFRDAETKK